MNFWKKPLNSIIIVLIRIYRATLSPSAGILRYFPFYPKNTCIFYPTCSEYAIAVFQKYPFLEAVRKTVYRLSRCHPGNDAQVDLP